MIRVRREMNELLEQEVNGLLDHNHKYKFEPDKIREILEYKHNLGFIFK